MTRLTSQRMAAGDVSLDRASSSDDAPAKSAETPALASSADLRAAIERTANWLFARQHADGHWVGELEGDSILQSEFILLLAFLGRERTDLARRCAQQLLDTQLADGGWGMYPGAKLDVSASVKAYFALKLTGHGPHEEPLVRARRAILAQGGADRVNSFTRFYLALLGQIDYSLCPAVPPEFVLLPTWFPVNIYRISAWSRTIFVPLSIVWAQRPVRAVAAERGIRELFVAHPRDWPPLVCPGRSESPSLFSWERFFFAVDGAIKLAERCGLLPLRKRAVTAATKWMLDRFQQSDGLGAIFPPIIWSVVALKALGFADDSPEVKYNLDQLDALVLGDNRAARLQPCLSPVWDTAITLRSLAAAGHDLADARVAKGVNWLLDREITARGDWNKTVRAEPGGWCFEYHNAFYPDVDDTAMVLMALREASGDAESSNEIHHSTAGNLVEARDRAATIARIAAASQRGKDWMLAMQNRDGGWGAFDRDNDLELLCRVPFADHNAMIDPSSPDLAARVLEALGMLGHRPGQVAVDRAIAYLRRTQEPDGSWYGRWGVNYIYGTWQALVGLRATSLPANDAMVVAGANWLIAHQQPCGGWGESPDSYGDRTLRGQGTPTASQTAWAVWGLVAAGYRDHPATQRGVRWLLDTQRPEGDWEETEFTGTGFPLVFYLRYHLYRVYFPLLALAKAIG